MNTFGIHFVIRVTKQQKNEMGAVFARISVNGRKSEISLKAKVLPKNWDVATRKSISLSIVTFIPNVNYYWILIPPSMICSVPVR